MALPARLACVASLFVLLPAFAAGQAVFHGVGDLPGGAFHSEIRDATKVDGEILAVGFGTVNPQSPGGDVAILWSASGGLVALPNLAPNLTETNPIIASAITPDGRFIASRVRFNPNAAAQRHAVRVTRDGLVNLDLGTLPGFPQQSVAASISSDGSILYGFARYNNGGQVQAVRYTAAGPTISPIPFPVLGDDISGPAGRGTSADGSVMVGTSTNSATDGGDFYGPGNHAFRYVHATGTVSTIPYLTGGSWNTALAVSPDGNLALALGDSAAAPKGEVYLHNAASGAITPLGTPGGGWLIGNNTAGITSDGAVVAIAAGESNGYEITGYVRNAAGWHDVHAILGSLGVDLTGWRLTTITGMSADGTLLFGSGRHNGNVEGWVAELPAGYLASYAATQPLKTIVGAWGSGVGTAIFLNDGHYYEIELAAPNDAQTASGFERGTYTFDPATGAFAITVLQDLNGRNGLSDASGIPGLKVTGTADVITLHDPDGGPSASVPRVFGSRPIVGAWFAGDAGRSNSSAVVVFHEDLTYFMAQDGDSSAATGDANGQDGMEYGTYTWDPTTGAFTATPIVDTNGEWGLSHPQGAVTVTVNGDILTFSDRSGSATAARVRYNPLVPIAKPNYQGVWWNAPPGSESGWGINFAHQGDTIFATWFTYGPDGKPLWLIAVLQKDASGAFSGSVSTVTGPPYDSASFDSSKVVETVVGTMTVTFSGSDVATMSYTVNGIAQAKTVVRQVFANPVPTCAWGAQPNLALATNFQDQWWKYPAASEAGWGINFAHQGDTIFATWFTYGADGKPLWFIVVARKTAASTYAGPVSTVTGPPFYSVPFDPSKVVETVVGEATITFVDGNRASFAYTVNGKSQAKEITRQVFNAPGTVCY
jgi:hypothetical protein